MRFILVFFVAITAVFGLIAAPTRAQQEKISYVGFVGAYMNHLKWMCGDWEGKDAEKIIRLHAKLANNGEAILYDAETGMSDNVMMPTYHGMYYWNPGTQVYELTQVDISGCVTQGTFRYTDTTKAEQQAIVQTLKGPVNQLSHFDIQENKFRLIVDRIATGEQQRDHKLDVVFHRVAARK